MLGQLSLQPLSVRESATAAQALSPRLPLRRNHHSCSGRCHKRQSARPSDATGRASGVTQCSNLVLAAAPSPSRCFISAAYPSYELSSLAATTSAFVGSSCRGRRLRCRAPRDAEATPATRCNTSAAEVSDPETTPPSSHYTPSSDAGAANRLGPPATKTAVAESRGSTTTSKASTQLHHPLPPAPHPQQQQQQQPPLPPSVAVVPAAPKEAKQIMQPNGAAIPPQQQAPGGTAPSSRFSQQQPSQPPKAAPNPPSPAAASPPRAGADLPPAGDDAGDEQPPEAGLAPDADLDSLAVGASRTAGKAGKAGRKQKQRMAPAGPTVPGPPPPSPMAAAAAGAAAASPSPSSPTSVLYPPTERNNIRNSWARLMRWSRTFRSKELTNGSVARSKLEKVVVFGGGSFGTAIGVALARQKEDLQVSLLLRDPYLCKDINELHCNTRYLKDYTLPPNVRATTSAAEAISGAQYAIHAVPVQGSRAFLQGVKDLLPPSLPIISVSKGVEVATGKLMSDLIPSALGRKQPTVYLSGPSFAKEVMDRRPTGLVAASKDRALARQVQSLLASPSMRVNISDDVVGVEICGALKNVLAIAAGIVEGLELGNNAMAALISQGCSEIRWLAEKMHAKPTTISGLSGLGDIMLTCYGSLSRNRSVGVRLGRGERLEDILTSSSQVAEGVATAGVVVSLARKYRVQLPVLTAVAQILGGHISAREAVYEIMNLPQIEER